MVKQHVVRRRRSGVCASVKVQVEIAFQVLAQRIGCETLRPLLLLLLVRMLLVRLPNTG